MAWRTKTYGPHHSPKALEFHKRNYRRRKAADPDYSRRNAYKHKYGITMEQYYEMETRQEGRCAICGVVPDRLHVDHDAATGVVRGLLCGNCNRAIGMFKHDPERLGAAIRYLGERLIA